MRAELIASFRCNQVRVVLPGFGRQIMHIELAVLERLTGTGWSLRRLAEGVLRPPGTAPAGHHPAGHLVLRAVPRPPILSSKRRFVNMRAADSAAVP